MSCKYKEGDWVRFYQSGGVSVIAEVNYTRHEIGGWKLLTDKGCVDQDSVLECRSKEVIVNAKEGN